MATTCLFCRIIGGAEPAHLVHEDETVVAILDIRPLFPGHCLVLPKAHYGDLEELPSDALPHFFEVVRSLSVSVTHAMGATGTFVAINNRVSQSVPHLHCHVVPRKPKDGLRGFFWPRTKYPSDSEMAEVAARIRALQDGGGRHG